jgi:uncharacterized alkaline shock family protein YloU
MIEYATAQILSDARSANLRKVNIAMPILGKSHPSDTRLPQAAHLPPNAVASTARRGKIEVSSRAIATIAGRAVAECYGVVGIAARYPRPGAMELLPPEHYGRGVVVRFGDDHVIIDLFVVLEYGLRITEIAHNIMENVKFSVERTLGLHVVRVNVNVQALRVSPDE